MSWNNDRGFVLRPVTVAARRRKMGGAEWTKSKDERARLRRVPDVRPEEVARARRLIADPAYPSSETLRRVAFLLAQHWETVAVL